MVENLKALQLRAAVGAVAEIDRAVDAMTRRKAEFGASARDGLLRGSRLEGLTAEQSAGKDDARSELLRQLGKQRQQEMQLAMDAHQASRTEARQVDRLIARLEVASELENQRKLQSESDDRHLSRREWLRSRYEEEEEEEA